MDRLPRRTFGVSRHRGRFLGGSIAVHRMAGIGASRPLPRTPAKVSSPNRHRPSGPGRRNGPSCPFSDLAASSRLRESRHQDRPRRQRISRSAATNERGRRTLNSLNSPAVDLDRAALFLGDDIPADRETKPGAFTGRLVVRHGWNHPFRRILRRGRDGLDAPNEVGLAERALRFEQVQYLEYQFVYGAIFGGEAEQPLREIETLL